eukprot:2969644-Pleurochrysis_carterae.AAC.11
MRALRCSQPRARARPRAASWEARSRARSARRHTRTSSTTSAARRRRGPCRCRRWPTGSCGARRACAALSHASAARAPSRCCGSARAARRAHTRQRVPAARRSRRASCAADQGLDSEIVLARADLRA